MAEELTTYERLSAPFAIEDHAKVNKGSGSQTYAPWTSYVQRLNDELGENWSFRAIREGFTETECWVLGEITAIVDGTVAVRQQYGCEPIAVGQKPNGDLLKKAATDAIKKAASLLGVGLYLSDKEEREAIEAEMRAAIQAEAKRQADERAAKTTPAPKAPAATSAASPGTTASPSASTPTASGAMPTSASTTGTPAPLEPTPLKTKVELVADLKKGMEYARSLGLDPQEPEPTRMNRADIEAVIEDLRTQCRTVLAERKKQQAS